MKDIDIDFIKTEVYYDQSSPSGLRWVYTKMTPNPKNLLIMKEQPSHIKDTVVGWIGNSEYWSLEILGVAYMAHRIIYSLVHGDIPYGMQIDHIDGNRTNNNINNLRTVTGHLNQRNKRKVAKQDAVINGQLFKGEDVPTGVRWDAQRDRWVAQCYNLEGKLVMKTFYPYNYKHSDNPVNEAFMCAVKCRENFIEELNGNGAGYTHDHGVRK